MSFGVYLHFPFCLSKCPYCDFASEPLPSGNQELHARYARAIEREADLRAGDAAGRTAVSLYAGGGTPSLWEPGATREAVEALRARVAFADDAEFTLEANPGASDAERFAAFHAAGFGRLSIGIQSLDDRTLRRLGRRHSAAEARAAVRAAREAGFGNLALDLIYGAPGQDVAGARSDAEQLVAMKPEHVSCYALTLEHLAVDVPLAKEVRGGRVEVPDEDAQWEMGEAVGAVLTAAGFARYEISNWARPGMQARHNSLYWTGGEYLGLGCGACGFALRDPRQPALGGRRWGNHRKPDDYLAAVEAGRLPEAWSEDLDAPTLLRERLTIGLRQVAGVDVLEVCAELEQDPEPLLAAARRLEDKGLATLQGGQVALTSRGLDLHSSAVLEFVE